jgi:hypothetical protein
MNYSNLRLEGDFKDDGSSTMEVPNDGDFFFVLRRVVEKEPTEWRFNSDYELI